jgi:hypothetical protein
MSQLCNICCLLFVLPASTTCTRYQVMYEYQVCTWYNNPNFNLTPWGNFPRFYGLAVAQKRHTARESLKPLYKPSGSTTKWLAKHADIATKQAYFHSPIGHYHQYCDKCPFTFWKDGPLTMETVRDHYSHNNYHHRCDIARPETLRRFYPWRENPCIREFLVSTIFFTYF